MSGLHNLGNTCYMNSVVQVLRYVKPVVEKLVKVIPEHESLKHFVDLLYQGSSPNDFAGCLKDFGFDPIYQHDAHEFLLTMLDKLYEGVNLKNPFEGTSKTVLKCKNGHISTRSDPFVALSINGGIEEGIIDMMEPEIVECKCETCGETSMTKTLDIDPSDVVCIHYKRFNLMKKLRYGPVIFTSVIILSVFIFEARSFAISFGAFLNSFASEKQGNAKSPIF